MRQINQMQPWIGVEEKNALIEYLDSGGWLTEHLRTRQFEQMIADYVNSKYATVVSNGTVSLMVSLMALGIGRDDEVIVPDYTMIASSNAITLTGAKPVFVDIAKQNLCLDPELLDAAITPRTKGIMLVTINGRYPDMNSIRKIADERGIYLIEDAAQSLGSRYDGKHLGTFGICGSFSFSAPKVITTGQGGVIVTDDPDLHQKITQIKDFGRTQSGVDYHEVIGFNAKFSDLQAVVGIEQMKKLDFRIKRKKEIYALYKDLLENMDVITFIPTDLTNTSPWFIDILLKNSVERDSLIGHLKAQGIGSRVFYPPIHTQPPYSWVKGHFPISENISQRGLWLPSSSFLTDDDISYICDKIRFWQAIK